MTHRILLDCDPGLDDALAILLAVGDPALELVGITTVGGNVSLANTTRNALQLREYLGIDEVPVAAGAAEPLVRAPETAAHVHGAEGLGDLVLPAARLAASEAHAVEVIIETLRAEPGAIHLVATGPLTTIALALRKEPRIAEWAASFTIMGGSFTRGNASPAAEFNIYVDPEAAAEVFAAGWTVTMVGLDLTLQALVTPEVEARMLTLGPIGGELVVPLATYYRNRSGDAFQGQAVHDVCAVAYLARPELFVSRPARVEVETRGEFTSGMTVVDFSSDRPNAIVPVELDVEGFWDYAHEAWGRVAPTRRHG
ncbi:nucleoside hydrolase [Galbitalea soli]|uniref:Nucleoside hydrolase n=1 Tax=Galbitalea soli TaxID=1268042 RepID=A0A7C9TPS1_9MICO|nr:nucleoside hydrolase [Galbitalea soli]NEM89803.1 nucleoside hydrolase [Galbitalea soli]NYJ30507.1 purine nucleosidase [Galbitalea soli]